MSSYDRLGQLANQHHHELLADARQRQLRQQGRSRTLRAPSALSRRLSAAFAKVGIGAAGVPDTIASAR